MIFILYYIYGINIIHLIIIYFILNRIMKQQNLHINIQDEFKEDDEISSSSDILNIR